MSLLQVIQCGAPAHVLVWKYPKPDITTGSRLVVGPAQEAVFVRGGSICDVLGPGSYTLDTSNLPLLSALVNLPFDRKSPFPAEVFFVNRLDILDVKWGTARHIQLIDPVYRVSIPLRAFGQYGVRVSDSALFLQRLAGTARTCTTQELADYFRGVTGSRIAEELSSTLLKKEICFLEANAHLTEIAGEVSCGLEPFFAGYGIQLVNFCINSINAPEGDPSVRRLREALSRRHEMDLLQYSYQQDRSFDVLEQAARNPGHGPGAADSQTGAALDSLLSGIVRGAARPAGQGQRFCTGCGAPLSSGDAFCPKCGKPAGGAHCPRCGAPLQEGSRFCSQCGQALT